MITMMGKEFARYLPGLIFGLGTLANLADLIAAKDEGGRIRNQDYKSTIGESSEMSDLQVAGIMIGLTLGLLMMAVLAMFIDKLIRRKRVYVSGSQQPGEGMATGRQVNAEFEPVTTTTKRLGPNVSRPLPNIPEPDIKTTVSKKPEPLPPSDRPYIALPLAMHQTQPLPPIRTFLRHKPTDYNLEPPPTGESASVFVIQAPPPSGDYDVILSPQNAPY